MQMALASQFGITHYPQPAGGCILTDPAFARRFQAFVSHFGSNALTSHVMQLLRHGRHFWVKPTLWVIVGRNEADNKALQDLAKDKWKFEPLDMEGPLVLVQGIEGKEDMDLVAGITARYCNKAQEPKIRIRYTFGEREGILEASPLHDTELEQWKVG
jgi:hypothetical protein